MRFLRYILNIKKTAWDADDPDGFYPLVMVKAFSILAVLASFSGILTSLKTPGSSLFILYLQSFALLVGIWMYFYTTIAERVKIASQICLGLLTCIVITMLIKSKSGDVSGAYHIVPSIILAYVFLLGVRVAGVVLIFFTVFYCAIILNMLPFNFDLPRIAPVRTQIYTDRIVEIWTIYLGCWAFTKTAERHRSALRAQEKIEAERNSLKSISRLADGIAHEINNPLSVIGLSVSRLVNLHLLKDGAEPIIHKITDAYERIADFVRCLTTLTTPRVGTTSVFNVLHEVEAIKIRLTSKLDQLSGKVTIINSIDPKLVGNLNLDAFQIIVTSILENAIEAASLRPSGGGQIEIMFQGTSVAPEIMVVDNGPDFEDLDLERFLQPFYTTKFDRPRRGLGLATAHYLATRYHWEIILQRVDAKTYVGVRMVKDEMGIKDPLGLIGTLKAKV